MTKCGALRDSWHQEQTARDEVRDITTRYLFGESEWKSLETMNQEKAAAQEIHSAARTRFEAAELEFLKNLSREFDRRAAEAKKHLADAIQLHLMLKLNGGVGKGLETLLPALDAFERFIAVQQAMTTAILGTAKDRIHKLRGEHHRVSCGEEDVLRNLEMLCCCLQMVLMVPEQHADGKAQHARAEWEDWKANAADWERFIDDTDGGNTVREWLENTLPAIALLEQFLGGWGRRIETDIHEWVAAVKNDVQKRLAKERNKISTLAKKGGSREELARGFEEIGQTITQVQDALITAEDATVEIIRRRPLQ